MINHEQAAELLRAILPDVWRRSCRLQRLRLITHEEMPWRAQVFLLSSSNCVIKITYVHLTKQDRTLELIVTAVPKYVLQQSRQMQKSTSRIQSILDRSLSGKICRQFFWENDATIARLDR